MFKLRCTFRPQAWINDNAYDIDVPADAMEGGKTWIVEVSDLPQRGSYDTDELREVVTAPQWVRNWRGPFEVDYEVIP